MARGRNHCKSYRNCPSIHNPATYAALRREGKTKTQAARISNGVLNRGVRKGHHRAGKKR